MSSRILIVEDDINLGETLTEYLNEKGHECLLSDSAEKARHFFETFSPTIILMDIGLPDGNGIDLGREFRNIKKNFSLLFLSAQNDPDTRLAGLEIGAEDYISKPFNLKELLLRLERIIHNQAKQLEKPEEISIGTLKIWFSKFQVQKANGEIVNLTQKENQILELLYDNRDKVVARDLILDKVWGNDQYPSNRTIDNYIVKLRKWCETDPENAQITSIRGVGYKFTFKHKDS